MIVNLEKSENHTQDKIINNNFINRKIYKDFKFLFENSDKNLLLFGETGAGKTYMTEHLAQEKSLDFTRISLDNTFSIQDLIGHWELNQATSSFKFGILAEAIQKPGIILLDELSAMDGNKIYFLHQLLDSGHLLIKEHGMIKKHKSCRLIAALNPHTRRHAGTNRLNTSLVNRFYVIEVSQFNKKELSEFLPEHKYKTALIEFYIKTAEAILVNDLDFEISIRNIMYIYDLLNKGFDLRQAINYGFTNSVKLLADQDSVKLCEDIAIANFGQDYIK